jgi:hypothetical protein
VSAVLEGYGTRLVLTAPDRELLHELTFELPRGWVVGGQQRCSPADTWTFEAAYSAEGYRVRDGAGQQRPCGDLATLVSLLHAQLRRYVGYHVDGFVFVHAGVVAYRGRAIVLPGQSFAGKSTLVQALVRAGADYYSDEYAMLDDTGRVAHYREPLSLRGPDGHEPLELGADLERPRIPVALVAFVRYRAGSKWIARRMTTGEAVVAAMQHSVPARERPADTLAILRLAFEPAQLLRGDRGDAEEAARALLAVLTSQPA